MNLRKICSNLPNKHIYMLLGNWMPTLKGTISIMRIGIK